ncbi:MAG: hypothetical protein AB7S99_05020 [Pseudodonghicola sp.]
MSGFYLHGRPDDRLRLKSFGATSKGAKSTIRIELETEDAFELGYALQSLAQVQEGQKPPKPTPKRQTKAKQLALPAPQLALPRPEDDA